MIRRPPRSTLSSSSAASDVYKRQLPIIVLTSQGSVDSALVAIRAGAQDFVVKPAGLERLQVAIKNTLQAARLAEEVRGLSHRTLGNLSFGDLAGESAEMTRAIRQGEK